MGSAPKTVSWPLEQHTAAKHLILRSYLKAWLPIISAGRPNVVLIDGFAGSGHYKQGEEGSPLLMLRAYVGRHDRDRFSRTHFTFLFIERDPKRFAALQRAVAAFEPLPANVAVLTVNDAFGDVMASRHQYLGTGPFSAPTFTFIDPFGYKQTDMSTAGSLLSFPSSEVFIYVPLYHIARFIDLPDQAAFYTNLFGDDRWRGAASIAGLDDRQRRLHELFAAALRQHATYVRSFEMRGKTPNTGYHLFFGSNNELGLRRMKEAMWEADPVEGRVFRDAPADGQDCLFDQPCYQELAAALFDKFGLEPFSIEEAARFTLVDTSFRDDAHLKGPVLGCSEKAGCLVADRHGRHGGAGQYPDGSTLRFLGNPVVAVGASGSPAVSEGATPVQATLWS